MLKLIIVGAPQYAFGLNGIVVVSKTPHDAKPVQCVPEAAIGCHCVRIPAEGREVL